MAPGDSTVVELIFRSRTYKTLIKKYATIYSNDPKTPSTRIHLEIKVDAAPDSTLGFTLSDNSIQFNGDRKKGEIQIISTSDKDIIFTQLNQPIDGLKVELKNSKLKPGKNGKLKFEWKNEIGKENVEESITFIVNDSTRFSIPVFIAGTDPSPPKSKVKKAAPKRNQSARNKSTVKGTRPSADKPGNVKSVKSKQQIEKQRSLFKEQAPAETKDDESGK